MNERILVRDGDDGPWVEPDTQAYTNETHLQHLLTADPARIPGVGPGALAVAELGTAAGPADIVAVHADGDLTVVECKLAVNRDPRRTVVGQVLDYASSIWQTGFEEFVRAFAACGGGDLSQLLPSDALDRLRTNIGEARVHLCLAVDRIDADLRRLVEFLNQITGQNVTVTAIEIAYARHGTTEILIPSTYGGELAAAKNRTASSGSAPHWTWETFLAALSEPADRVLAEDIASRADALERRDTHDLRWYGKRPNGNVFFRLHGYRYSPFHLWQNKDSRLFVYGSWNSWSSLDPSGFVAIADALGQDPGSGRSVAVPASSLDLDRFWEAALRTSEEINRPAG